MTRETYGGEPFDYERAWAELRSEREQRPPSDDVPLGHLHVLRERLLESFARAGLKVLSRHPMTATELAERRPHTLLVVFEDPRSSIEVFQIPDAEIEGSLERALAWADHVDDPEGPSGRRAHVGSVRVLNAVGRCASLSEVVSRLAGYESVEGYASAGVLEAERGVWRDYLVAHYGDAGDAGRQEVDLRLLDTRIDRVVVLRWY